MTSLLNSVNIYVHICIVLHRTETERGWVETVKINNLPCVPRQSMISWPRASTMTTGSSESSCSCVRWPTVCTLASASLKRRYTVCKMLKLPPLPKDSTRWTVLPCKSNYIQSVTNHEHDTRKTVCFFCTCIAIYCTYSFQCAQRASKVICL